MDPKFVNLLIQQLLNTTTCPKCSSNIMPVNVKIEHISKDKCLFKMKCSKCQTVISADAQMSHKKEVPPNEINQKKNPSSQGKIPLPTKKTNDKKVKAVSLDELMQMKKTMQNFSGSFNKLFQ